MNNVLDQGGNALAVLGLLMCIVAGATRLLGSFYVFNLEAMTLFNAGTAVLIVACFAKLQLILQAQTKTSE